MMRHTKDHPERQLAFQALYGHSFQPSRNPETLAKTFAVLPLEEDGKIMAYREDAWKLAFGVFLNEKTLDDLISRHLIGWKPERVGKSERILLRMGAYEILATGLPVAEVASAMRNLAIAFGLLEARNFISGILESIGRAETGQTLLLPSLSWQQASEMINKQQPV